MDNIENIYSLSSLQQGLLFHTVSEPDSRVYQQQLSLWLKGKLDTQAFTEAWRRMLAHHAVLRTAILWEDLDDAYQVVLSHVDLPLQELDWRGRADAEAALKALEIAEREAVIELTAPPLMRLCLVRLGDAHWHLIWTHHHIVLDGWSEGIVLRDWLGCYKALSQGRTPQLQPCRPFQDYIAWLEEQDAAAAEGYWRKRLSPITEPTPLPSFAGFGSLQNCDLPCAEQALVLTAEQSQKLTQFARAQHITLNTLIQAAWGLLLGSYAGDQKAMFGVTLAGRPDAIALSDDMVGLFINTLPLVIDWTEEQSIGEWLRAIQSDAAELRQYEHSPLSRLKTFSSIPADRSLFEAILVFENFPLDESLSEESQELRFIASDEGELVGDVRRTQGRNNFPLSLIAIPSGEAFEFALAYARERFADEQIRQMLQHFQSLLIELTKDAERPVSDLNWLSANEAQQLLDWGTGKELAPPSCALHQLFERHAERCPDQPALITQGQTFTYAKLDGKANQLARHLQSLGLEPGQFAALALERSADFVIALLAVLKAGAAYLPLDLKQPAARLADLVKDSEAKLLITQNWHLPQLAQYAITQVLLSEVQESLADLEATRLPTQVSPSQPAYLIYTSGSTGKPKGVVIEHHAIVNYLAGLTDALQLSDGCRFGMVSTVAADLGHTQLFGALAGGGTLVLADEEIAFQPAALANFFAAHQVDVLKLTPSHLRGLLSAHPSAQLLPAHTLIFGGEPLNAELVDRVRALKPSLRIVNHYGPTETTVGAVFQVLDQALDMTRPVALGKPLPNRRLYVLDSQGHLAPIGVPGELFIGGAAIAREYWQRPELTAERFLADPFAGLGQRMYRTGDRVRWLADGTLEFLGRVDNQVKIRGYRVELGEVETQIQKLAPQIRQVVARLLDLPDQPSRLVAYVVADEALSAEKLTADLSLRVPEFMVPTAFVMLDAIPLNANGKPDYKQLPLPDTGHAAQQNYVAPRNEVERQLAEIWQAVLKVERIGVHDNFFSLGGDSILNLQIIARAGQLGLKLTPKQLFEHRTIAQLASLLRPDAANDLAGEGLKAIEVPLTAGQRERLERGSLRPTWRQLAVAEDVSVESVTRALQAVQQHHRALQMAFTKAADGHWQQTLPIQVSPVRTSSRTVAAQDSASLDALAISVASKLDVQHGETLHACLLDDGARRTLLLIAHPLAVDEASWPNLLTDFALALAQVQNQQPIALSPTGGDWIAWAEHQQSYAKSDALDASWEHWLQYAGMDVATLALSHAGDCPPRSIRLDEQVSRKLAQVQRQSHVDWEALLITALAELIGEDANASPLLLNILGGRPSLNRLPLGSAIARADFNPCRMIGALAHSYPLFLNWDNGVQLESQILSAQRQLAEQPHFGADYGVLRYLSDNGYLQEPLASLPKAQISLSWLGDWDAHMQEHAPLQDVLATNPPATNSEALNLAAHRQQGRLCLDLQGPLTATWSDRLVQKLTEIAALADSALEAPAPSAFPLCAAQQKRLAHLHLDWSNIEDVYPLSATQQGMLLHTQLAPQSGVYLMQEQFRWEGQLSRSALERAWQHLLQRHSILRTGFTTNEEDLPLQYVCRELNAAPEWFDWRALHASERQQRLNNVLDAELRQGFDLHRPPLMQLKVFQVGEQEYLLVRSFHHLLSDAWSFNLVMSDLLALYQAANQNEPLARPLGRPFGDYIRWLMRQDLTAAEHFWKQELQGFDEPTPLAIDRRSANDSEQRTAETEVHVSVALTEKLRERCQQYQLTANTWLQGAWALLLSRYSGKQDVLFGVTVAGRPSDLADVDSIAGVFINALPLRVAVDDEQAVAPWLTQLFERNIQLRDYEHTPLSQIQNWSEVERGRSLFDTLMIYENAPLDTSEATRALDFSIDMVEDRGHTNYPLSLMVLPGTRLGLRLTFDANRFESGAVDRMLGHLSQFLEQMLEQPELPVGGLNLLTAPERQQILVDWNQSQAEFPLDKTFAVLFAERVAQHPERIAAVCMGESLTYAELDARANRIAQALIAAGAKPDTLVALLAERGLALLSMMIAVFKAGAAYQPLDTNHPPERLAELLTLGGAPIVLVAHNSAALLDQVLSSSANQPHCLVAEDLWLQGPATAPAVPGGPADLAYMIFTSGSTGTPKGAMVEQRGMLNNIFGKIPALGISENDRLAQTASPAFDISVWQFLAAPLLGATVHILPDEITQEPARLLTAVDEQGITLMEVVPSVIRAMLAEAPQSVSLATLRWLMSIGEALPPALCRQWFVRFPNVPLLNLYGPAECADNIGYYPITEAPGDECRHLPIGRPTANNHLYVLDHALRPVPVGVPGEICTSGVGVGRGYLNDSERTALAFVPHPFEPGARFYRTGDIGRYLPNGVIEYLGRRDQQVKVRGQRIELAEIENRLSAHPAVHTAVVLALPDERGDTRLVAYWQASPEGATGSNLVSTLREQLARTLPSYMVPSIFVQLEQLPLNANGKLDRKALAALVPDSAEPAAGELVAPRTATEEAVSAIFAEVLSLAQVGVEESFFALGGHSLLATQVVSRVRSRFEIELPLKALFDHPTVAGLSAQVDARQSGAPVLPPITQVERAENLPVSFAQQRLWFLEQLHPGSSVFTIPFALSLTGALDQGALAESFSYLIGRHEVLRTGFVSRAGEPWQQIQSPAAFELPLADLSAVSGAAQTAALQQQLSELFRAPFNLQQPPLLRARLFKLDQARHVLTVTLHHIAVDDWSISLLIDDLTAAYSAFSNSREPSLAPLPLQYSDFASWQRSHLPGPVWDQQLNYWRQQLAGCTTELSLPGARTREAGGKAHAERVQQVLPPALTQSLQQQAEATGSSLFMVLQAALNVLLHQQTGASDLLVGTDVANRHREETETMVGFFVNQLVLRCRVQSEQSFVELLADCRDTALAAYQHQDLPFDALVAELLPKRTADTTPFFQIKLILQNAPQQDLSLPGLQIEEWPSEAREAEFDLLINCIPTADGLQILYNYDASRYSRSYIEQLAALFENLLQSIATEASSPINDLVNRLNQKQRALEQQTLEQARGARVGLRASLATAKRKTLTPSE